MADTHSPKINFLFAAGPAGGLRRGDHEPEQAIQKKADQSDPSTLLFLENLLDNQLGPDAQRLKFLKYEKVSGRRSLVEMLTTDLFESNINQIAGS